jgi:formylglycine-generating enzyme required for sulfatase activity
MTNTRGKYSVMSYDFYPDNNGIYNMFGNVAEMVEEEGVSKGGSYNDFAKKCHSKEVIEYTGPAAWLGFRYCVVWDINQ